MAQNPKNRAGIRSSEKILRAAREEFLEKGFEKANMEAIARRAGFNKVMLYYHFNSKEQLLRELIGGILSDAEERIHAKMKLIRHFEVGRSEFFLATIRSVLGSNREIIRLITVELLKGTLDTGLVVKLLNGFYEAVARITEKNGYSAGDRETFYVKLFFFQTVPLILFDIISDDIAQAMRIKPKKMNAVFSDKFRETFRQTLKPVRRKKTHN